MRYLVHLRSLTLGAACPLHSHSSCRSKRFSFEVIQVIVAQQRPHDAKKYASFMIVKLDLILCEYQVVQVELRDDVDLNGFKLSIKLASLK